VGARAMLPTAIVSNPVVGAGFVVVKYFRAFSVTYDTVRRARVSTKKPAEKGFVLKESMFLMLHFL
jgi:hypothetical protein